jgi:hypothetical protein
MYVDKKLLSPVSSLSMEFESVNKDNTELCLVPDDGKIVIEIQC